MKCIEFRYFPKNKESNYAGSLGFKNDFVCAASISITISISMPNPMPISMLTLKPISLSNPLSISTELLYSLS